MVKLVVGYGPPTDVAAFDAEYADNHVPLARKIPDVQRFEAGKVLGTADGSAAPYHLIAELTFESTEVMQNALASPDGQAAAAHAAEIGTGGVTFMIVEA